MKKMLSFLSKTLVSFSMLNCDEVSSYVLQQFGNYCRENLRFTCTYDPLTVKIKKRQKHFYLQVKSGYLFICGSVIIRNYR